MKFFPIVKCAACRRTFVWFADKQRCPHCLAPM
jgi:hypothetical protein